uniref:Chromatin assembly factor 1 subunit A-like n=1 Tax=Sinocyclocheilus rhinocerous TaxID=307959 RepID=A0A673MMP7_9TELE
MVVVMLAAEEPLASTPRRARLPFKRLNPEPKECNEPKRTKGPVAPKSSEPSASDGENYMEHSSTPLHHGPALVNGRGPLDCFMSSQKRSPVPSGPEATNDLGEDSNDAVKQQPAPPVAATCPLSEETTKNADHATKSTEPTMPLTNKETEKDEDALPLLDITQDSDTEEEEQQETEVSHGNESVLSTGSTSSLSVVESSPEPSKSAPTTPASVSRHELMLYRFISSFRIKAEKAEITRFLQKPKTQLAPKTLASACGKFAPFEIKANMSLAPLTRVQCEDAVLEELDRYLAQPDSSLNGLKDWTRHKPRSSGPTRPSHSAVRDCVVITDSQKADDVPDRHRYGRMKLLHFHDNYRPAYWGTWCKKSTHISPRCPLRQDKELLDYEVDSDEEWEEEEPGESLSHSEGDDDDEGGDDDDDDDGFFVPHGYLSEGEGALEEDEEGGDPEKQKLRQRMKAREWEHELMSKGKVKVLEAVVRGCLWDGEEPALDLLQPYAICMLEPLPRDEPCTPEQELSRQQRSEKLLSQLLPLLHGNVNSSKVIINEFLEFCRQQASSPTESPLSFTDIVPPRIHVRRIIKEHAVYKKRSTYRRCCWYVHPEVLARHSQEALPVPCQWTYLTSGAQITRDEHAGSQGNSPTASSSTTPSNKRKSASSHSITKYMKKCGDSEQTEAMETDGFQADTEDEDDDCIIIGEQSGSSEQDANTSLQQTEGETEPMDTNESETAALALPCLTPATA